MGSDPETEACGRKKPVLPVHSCDLKPYGSVVCVVAWSTFFSAQSQRHLKLKVATLNVTLRGVLFSWHLQHQALSSKGKVTDNRAIAI